jgi:AcrR family transcriptional regulator
VGISAAALYRHFPNKYALFAECANVMVDGLVAALDTVPSGASLSDVLAAVTRVTVAHHSSGGLYRWEARYLNRDDRKLLRSKFAHVVERVTEAARRESPRPGEGLRAAAALGAIGSITMHHTSIAPRRAEDLLLSSALRVAATDPAGAAGSARSVRLPPAHCAHSPRGDTRGRHPALRARRVRQRHERADRGGGGASAVSALLPLPR